MAGLKQDENCHIAEQSKIIPEIGSEDCWKVLGGMDSVVVSEFVE